MKWFKHQSNMRHDVKLKRVINRYGLEGYGLYNLILESITEALETESPLPILQDTVSDIAEFYNANSAKIEEMIHFMVNQKLFDFTEKSDLACIKVYKYLQASQTRSKEIRLMIKNYGEMSDNIQFLDMSETVLDNYDEVIDNCEEEKRREQKRREEKRKEENRKEHSPKTSFHPFQPSQRQYPKEYETLRTQWNSLNLPECRYTALNLPNWNEIMNSMNVYTLEEVTTSIQNYSDLHDRERGITYTTFPNFLIRGIEKYADSSHPHDTFKESEDEKEKRIKWEAYAKLYPEDAAKKLAEQEA